MDRHSEKFAFARCVFLCVAAFSAAVAGEDNWPQFRGPGGDGQAAESKLALTWSETKNVKWKIPIHGKGWSSPVVWGDQLWLTTATQDGKKLFAVCVNRRTGEIEYDLLVFENEKPRYCHPTNSYASPTPALEEGRIYVHFGSYGTACLDTQSGKTLWSRRDLKCNHWRGPGSSPIVEGDLLIVAYDGYDQQYVVAFNKNNGETVWKKDRNIDYGTNNGDRMKAYCTCTAVDFGGRRQVISPSAVETISYDPATGDVLWRVRHGGMNAAARPLFGHGLVYIAAGSGQLGLIALRPDGKGDVTDSHIEWRYGRNPPKRPSQLLIGERLFMVNDDGVAACLNAKTGQIVWQARLEGTYRASPVYADGKIYFFGLDGQSPVIAAADEFKLLAENSLNNGFQASPAVVGNSLYLRTTKHLYCIEE